MLVGCLATRRRQPLCPMVRYRLAADRSGIARQGAGAVFARTLCKLSEQGRYRAGLRSAGAECRDRGLWHALSHCGRYVAACGHGCVSGTRSEEHTSELQSLMRISYAVFCLKNKKQSNTHQLENHNKI